jgi:hypothetical protein
MFGVSKFFVEESKTRELCGLLVAFDMCRTCECLTYWLYVYSVTTVVRSREEEMTLYRVLRRQFIGKSALIFTCSQLVAV